VLSRLPGPAARCPVCDRSGRLTPVLSTTGVRRAARCPGCGALERHRLQIWTLKSRVLPVFDGTGPRVLHVAPERSVAELLRPIAGRYVTADFALPGMDLRLDLRDTDLPDASFDLVYASHVLEHIDRDRDALAEIRRILAPGGLAVLPVPLVGDRTVEYPEPNPLEAFHVRAPGYDYYDRYAEFFDRVELFSSEDAPAEAQTFIFEDRSHWPTRTMPHRRPSTGERHRDVVPLCWVD
jgi:SAM-dependent methyltransferase